MLKLTYSRKSDPFQAVTVIGDAEGIRDLYWQLTRNYAPRDGTEIGEIKITNLDGHDCTEQVMKNPHLWATQMSRITS